MQKIAITNEYALNVDECIRLEILKEATSRRIKFLICLYNSRSKDLKRVERYFIECYVFTKGYVTYTYNGEIYYGPQNATDKIKEEFYIPIEAKTFEKRPSSLETSNENLDIDTGLVSPINKAEELGFIVGYSNKLTSGNTEYLLINPRYNAALYFELTEKRILDNRYNLKRICPIMIPHTYNVSGENKVCLDFLGLDSNTKIELEENSKESISRWPLINLGREKYFISIEEEKRASGSGLDYNQKMLRLSLITLIKIHQLPRELQEIFGEENIALAEYAVNNLENYDTGSVKLTI